MKNKKLLYCQVSTKAASFKAGRPVFLAGGPEGGNRYAVEKNAENALINIKLDAGKATATLQGFNGTKNENNLAKKYGDKVQANLTIFNNAKDLLDEGGRDIGRDAAKLKLNKAYDLLQESIKSARTFLDAHKPKEAKPNKKEADLAKKEADLAKEKIRLEVAKLKIAAKGKLNDAKKHFLSDAVKGKNVASSTKVANDYISGWWKSLTETQKGLLQQEGSYYADASFGDYYVKVSFPKLSSPDVEVVDMH